METAAAEEPPHSGDQQPPPKPRCSPSNACFDCNICLDFAVEPVVTICGHLYCWPCIYKWLHDPSETVDAAARYCPVCKTPLSQDALVPVYGRGLTTKGSHRSLEIPNRPSVHRTAMIEHQPPGSNEEDEYLDLPPPLNHYDYPYHRYDDYMPSSSPTGVFNSTAGGLLGGMAVAILPWVSGNHEAAAGGGYYSRSSILPAAAGGSRRTRRQEVRVADSLQQIWGFLFCCAILCLLFF